MKLFKRIILVFLLLFLVVATTLLVIAYAYENEVKVYMIQQLNKHLKTKVIVDGKNVKLSLLRNFPYASLDFKNVVMLESMPQALRNVNGKSTITKMKAGIPDTLFSVERISLQFNIFDILL